MMLIKCTSALRSAQKSSCSFPAHFMLTNAPQSRATRGFFSAVSARCGVLSSCSFDDLTTPELSFDDLPYKDLAQLDSARQFCMGLVFLDVLQDFMAALGAEKKLRRGAAFYSLSLDDGGAGGEVGFFFVKKSEFLLAFCVVSACAQKHGFAGTFVAIWKAFDEKKIGLAAVPLILQEVICLDEGAFVFLWIVVKNEVIGIEEGFEIAHEADAAFDFAEIPALVSVGV